MKRLFVTTYRFREGLGEDGLRECTKKFAEVGNAPGVIAHYFRSDGKGGFVVAEADADEAKTLETLLRDQPWIEFDTHPVTTIEEAFPVILSVYG